MKPGFYPRIISVLLIGCLFVSCKRFVELDAPKDRVSTEVLFSDSTNAVAAVLGMYIDVMNTVTTLDFLNGGITVYSGLMSDELRPYNPNTDVVQFYTNSVSPTLNNINNANFWRPAYGLIYKANACIEGVTASTFLSERLKRQLVSESKFVRAMTYFNLVNIYGDVPIVLGTDFKVNAAIPRSSIEDVYNQIEKDLLESIDSINEVYETDSRLRPNKFAAIALLARVELYRGKWSKAEEHASAVIDNYTVYTLESDLNNVFSSTSMEVIWQLVPVAAGFETAEGYAFVPSSSSAVPRYIISKYLFNEFEPGDLRKEKWMKKNRVSQVDYYYPYKYKVRRGTSGSTDYKERFTILRLAEQYLIRAEARGQLGKIDGVNSAMSDVNILRARAGLLDSSVNSKQELLSLIAHERKVELFCEGGHRWFDLKRTNELDHVMGVVSADKGIAWEGYKKLLPVPLEEIKANPALIQNDGYMQ